MTSEEQNTANALRFKMHLLQAEITMNGMIATNMQCVVEGSSIAYQEKQFNDLIDKFGIHDNAFPDFI